MGSRLIALVAVGALIVAGAVAAVVAADEGPHSGGDWPRFGKTTDNTRFSPADRIDASTVGDLELAWELGQEHAAPSRESNPVVVDRRMYLTTASGEVLQMPGRPWASGPRVLVERAPSVADALVHAGAAASATTAAADTEES